MGPPAAAPAPAPAPAVALSGAARPAPAPRWRWAWLWLGALGALTLAVLAYPLGATPARLADRFNPLPPTLDGMAYMPYASIEDGHSEVTALHPGGVELRAGRTPAPSAGC